MTPPLSLTLNIGGRIYREQEVREIETLMGAERVFAWDEGGKTGYVVFKGQHKPMICSCIAAMCIHRSDIRGYVTDGEWEPPAPVAA